MCCTVVVPIVDLLEVLEAFCLGMVGIGGIGDESNRRSVGSRHFEWRMGLWFKRQWLMLLLSAHDRHALL